MAKFVYLNKDRYPVEFVDDFTGVGTAGEKVFFYFEEKPKGSLSLFGKLNDTELDSLNVLPVTETVYIPDSETRNLRFFEYGKPYKDNMYYATLPVSYFSKGGDLHLTVVDVVSSSVSYTYDEFRLMSKKNSVSLDLTINMGQYYSILSRIKQLDFYSIECNATSVSSDSQPSVTAEISGEYPERSIVFNFEIPKSKVDVDKAYVDKQDEYYLNESKTYIDSVKENVNKVSSELSDRINGVAEVAKGKSKATTYSTLNDLVSAVSGTLAEDKSYISLTSALDGYSTGDVFYVVETDVPDYWYDSTTLKLYKMETTKVDLSGLATKEDVSNETSRAEKAEGRIKDILDYSTIGREIDFSEEHKNEYIAYTGGIDTANGFAWLGGINVNKGDQIIFKAKGFNTGVSMITKIVDSMNRTPLVISIDNNVNVYSYVVKENMTVALCYDYNAEHDCIIVKSIDNVDLDKTNLISDIEFSNPTIGKLVNVTGGIESSDDFSYINVSVKQGEKIELSASGFGRNIAMISLVKKDGSFYPLVISVGSDTYKYEYTANNDMTLALCYDSTKVHKATKYFSVNELANNNYLLSNSFGYCGMFSRIAVIGDSLSSGNITVDGQQQDVYGNSWLSYLALKINAKARTHYSHAGLTTKTWLSSYKDKMMSDTPFNAYFIALGTNDIPAQWGTGSVPMGTIDDTAGTDSFVGYYKEIIESVREHAPHAVIFLLSQYRVGAWQNSYNGLVVEMANAYDNCFYIDYSGNATHFDDDGETDYTSNGHFTTMGYMYVASIIYEQVNKAIEQNPSFFKSFGKYNPIGDKFED